MLQSLLDRFSADSQVCRTLSAFLLLISALLGDPIFAEEALLAAGTQGSGTTTGLSERRMRLSTLRLGNLLRGRRSENLVKAVTSRLEVGPPLAS